MASRAERKKKKLQHGNALVSASEVARIMGEAWSKKMMADFEKAVVWTELSAPAYDIRLGTQEEIDNEDIITAIAEGKFKDAAPC